MSHEVETMAYAGETPWHGLGVRVSNDMTPEQMMKAAGLDWEVKKKPLFINTQSKYVKVLGKQALVRTRPGQPDDVLDMVGSGWNPVQNAEAFAFFDDFVKEGHMEMHTAGSLRTGRVVWALAKINDSFEPVKGDLVNGFMLFTNPHIYGRPSDVRYTPIRVVCNNTLTMALNKNAGSKNSVTVNHRQPFNAERVKELLGIAHGHMETYKETAKFLASVKADKESLSNYFNQVFPRTSDSKGNKEPSRQHDRAMGIIDKQPGHEFAPGTWWQALNAVTYICDHEIGSDATRLDNAWYGHNRNRKLKAMDLAVEMANAVR